MASASSIHRDKLIEVCLGVFCQIKNISHPSSEKLESDENFVARGGDDLSLCGKPIIQLLMRQSDAIRSHKGDFELIMQRLDDLVALANEKFYAFPFKDVPSCWRALFRHASFLKFSALAVRGSWEGRDQSHLTPLFDSETMDQMVKIMDTALIMAGPPSSHMIQEAINCCWDLLQEIYLQLVEEDEPASKRRKTDPAIYGKQNSFPAKPSFVPPISNPISRIAQPTFDAFEKRISNPRDLNLGPEPIIITGAIESWPARNSRSWKNPSYLLSKTIGGRRLVPIEVGRSYVDDGWGQKIVPFKQFIEEFILLDPKSSGHEGTGYLAQHNLFAQISSLRQDITIPDYCYTSPPPPHHSSPLAKKHSEVLQLEDPLLNAWFGPAGTISPLHTDPYHNILAQVVGRKYVRLYAPRESERVYARGMEDGGVDMGNTSATDIGVLAGWDGNEAESREAHEKFPLFRDADYMDCILEEGECLYIPTGWWHYVRSLSVSFSVSFWFN
ncbi:hypothetical protein B7494_g130 [Chlorociboria aeruginascens]|nr:hypothetical protein B7494_g130 [Chlorociboria aeruginascens]